MTTSMVAAISIILLQKYILPHELHQQVIIFGPTVTLLVATPITYFVGLRMRDIHLLTVELENAVRYDTLTGATTRASFFQQVEKIDKNPLSLIFADIDHFKAINDTHGHGTGDIVLQAFARTLIKNCRKDDIVARFGGEEFAILLIETEFADGISAAQRMCKQVRDLAIDIDGARIQITASFGVAEVKTPTMIDAAIHNADIATFRAKNEGRDRVWFYDPDSELGTTPE